MSILLAHDSKIYFEVINLKTKTCCFTGHRRIQGDLAALKRKLKNAIIALIEKGVIYYGCGGAIGFDTLASLSVLELKKDYPQIKLIMVLPCHGQEERWAESDRKQYFDILEQADKIVYVSEHYHSNCMFERNRRLVNYSNYCIAYLKEDSGGTAYTVNYARRKGLRVINLNLII